MVFDSLFEKTSGAAIEVLGFQAEDVEPGWHIWLALRLTLGSALRASLGVAQGLLDSSLIVRRPRASPVL